MKKCMQKRKLNGFYLLFHLRRAFLKKNFSKQSGNFSLSIYFTTQSALFRLGQKLKLRSVSSFLGQICEIKTVTYFLRCSEEKIKSSAGKSGVKKITQYDCFDESYVFQLFQISSFSNGLLRNIVLNYAIAFPPPPRCIVTNT